MRSLTLLIQLFGRDIMDRLAAAGFDTARAIMRAGADRVAGHGGIELPLARRIVAVATESEASAEEDASAEAALIPDAAPRTAGRAPAAATRGAAGRRGGAAAAPVRASGDAGTGADQPADGGVHVRRPLRRPSSPLATGRPPVAEDTELEGTIAAASDAMPETAEEPSPGRRAAESPLDAHPFVDDVGLIAWMGLKARDGSGGASFGVADGILDRPRRPAAADRSPILEEAPILEAPLDAAPMEPVAAVAPDVIVPAPAPAPAPIPEPARAPEETRPPREALRIAPRTARPLRPVPGSFWSFGRPAGDGAAPATRSNLPRRRAHDEQ